LPKPNGQILDSSSVDKVINLEPERWKTASTPFLEIPIGIVVAISPPSRRRTVAGGIDIMGSEYWKLLYTLSGHFNVKLSASSII